MPEIDIKFESWPPSKGGQHVGTVQGVKASYDGIEAIVTCERSQHKNKAIAEDGWIRI